MKLSALSLPLFLGAFGAAGAHVGTEIFMPQVPYPAAITIDGNEDDWGWYDQSFAVTPDQIIGWRGQHSGTAPPAGDFSATYFVAWSAQPDNRLFVFIRVTDDTLRAAEGEERVTWWNDDLLQISIDADHSGGSYLGENLDELANGQRYTMTPLHELPVDIGSHMSDVDGHEQWAGDVPHTNVATTVSPADAANLSVNVTYTYEWAIRLWDMFGQSEDDSVPHIFAPEQVIHVSVRFDDGDHAKQGQQSLFGLQGGNYFGDRDGNQAGDYIALPTADEGTVVAHISWARIKSYLNQSLQK